ncbi:MAG: hypothetical protein RL885_05460 [Planctomycetota bacterium]
MSLRTRALSTTVLLLSAAVLLVTTGSCNSEDPKEYVFAWPIPTDVPVDFQWDRFGKVTQGKYRMILEQKGDALEVSYRDLSLVTYADRKMAELPEAEQAALLEALLRQMPRLRISSKGRVLEVLGIREAGEAMLADAREAGLGEEQLSALEARLTDEDAIELLEWRAREHWKHLVEDFIGIDCAKTDTLLRQSEIPAIEENVRAQEDLTHQGPDPQYPRCVRFRIHQTLQQEQAKRIALEKARSALTQVGIEGAQDATFLDEAEIFNVRSESYTSIRLDTLQPYHYLRHVTTKIQARNEPPVKLEERYEYTFRWPSSN